MKQNLVAVLCIYICILMGVLCVIMLYGSNPTKTMVIPEGKIKDSLKHSQDTDLQEMSELSGKIVSTALSKLAYLVQTESCLPDPLKSVEVFGNTLACQCDVFVLGYKQPCTETPLHNVEYFFNSSTTWASGRNLLSEAALRRSEKYLYYIFMDDDIVLKTKTEFQNPWTEFENFLKTIEPAVAAVNTPQHQALPVVYEARNDQGCVLDKPAECLPTIDFDQCLNAFHYQVVEHLLPYITKFDSKSFSLCGFYIKVKCEILFRGKAVILKNIHAMNPKHRPYPHQGFNIDRIIREAVAQLPKEYQISSLALQW